MPRINPVNPETATGKAKELLTAVKSKMGMVPNMMATLANSPAVLESYLSFSGALNGASLNAKTREAIAIAIAEANGCNYCLSAHAVIGKGAGLSDAEVTAARTGESTDAKLGAILTLANAINTSRGFATDAEILEVVATVSLNVFTNYLNHVSDPTIDFPVIKTKTRTPELAGV